MNPKKKVPLRHTCPLKRAQIGKVLDFRPAKHGLPEVPKFRGQRAKVGVVIRTYWGHKNNLKKLIVDLALAAECALVDIFMVVVSTELDKKNPSKPPSAYNRPRSTAAACPTRACRISGTTPATHAPPARGHRGKHSTLLNSTYLL